MGRKRAPVNVATVDGKQMVLLEPTQYEVFQGYRRQLGGLQTQIRRVWRDLHISRDRVAMLTQAIVRAGEQVMEVPCSCSKGSRCGRCAALDVLTSALAFNPESSGRRGSGKPSTRRR
jgi:hypothetical protein